MERTMIYTIGEETPTQAVKDEFIMEIDPYGGKRVNKRYSKLIQQMVAQHNNVKAHFPLEPFHYREVKRHATELAMNSCVEYNVPMSLETQKEVPLWAMELLTRHKLSEIKIGMNTFNKKRWKATNPMSSDPNMLRESFIKCFNSGIYTVLTIAPVVAGVISFIDIFEVVDTFKHWTKGVEISKKSFDEVEFKEARELFLSKKLGDISEYYVKRNGQYVIRQDYWKPLTTKLNDFLTGTKLELVIKE